ncbi:uncharacterized protein [Symphalangus syndactylus]|uniref:uncharacterized protein n=1 Tax=Symphalangus syndactylus TaxID=9590 RepID=UPI0030064C92
MLPRAFAGAGSSSVSCSLVPWPLLVLVPHPSHALWGPPLHWFWFLIRLMLSGAPPFTGAGSSSISCSLGPFPSLVLVPHPSHALWGPSLHWCWFLIHLMLSGALPFAGAGSSSVSCSLGPSPLLVLVPHPSHALWGPPLHWCWFLIRLMLSGALPFTGAGSSSISCSLGPSPLLVLVPHLSHALRCPGLCWCWFLIRLMLSGDLPFAGAGSSSISCSPGPSPLLLLVPHPSHALRCPPLRWCWFLIHLLQLLFLSDLLPSLGGTAYPTAQNSSSVGPQNRRCPSSPATFSPANLGSFWTDLGSPCQSQAKEGTPRTPPHPCPHWSRAGLSTPLTLPPVPALLSLLSTSWSRPGLGPGLLHCLLLASPPQSCPRQWFLYAELKVIFKNVDLITLVPAQDAPVASLPVK